MKSFLFGSGLSLLCALALRAQIATPPEATPSFSATPLPTASASAAATAAAITPAATAPVTTPAPARKAPVARPTPAAAATAPNEFAENIKRKALGRHKKGFHIDINDGDGAEDDSSKSHDSEDIPSAVIPIVAISVLAVFGFPVAIVAVIMFSSWAKARSLHRTVRTLVERGQPVPPELLASPAGAPLRPWYDLRRGIVLLAVGVGVVMFFGIAAGWDEGVWALGLIPGLIGLGYILAWRLAQKQANGFKV
ncbi:MAG: DUF6249 domain-containing protein [Verrucomicrobiota bacterium]